MSESVEKESVSHANLLCVGEWEVKQIRVRVRGEKVNCLVRGWNTNLSSVC